MAVKEYMNTNSLDRIVLVGTNSQGKSFELDSFSKDRDIKGCSIYICSEVKADENMKNSADSTTLVSWLNRLVAMTELKEIIDDKISGFDFANVNEGNCINVGLSNDFSTYKGLIGVNISTSSNTFGIPGSGEKFLGQLYIISKILEDNEEDYYKYLIVDEPERHLHPSLHMKMGMILNKISKQGIKVIISTHSPEIANHFIDDTNEIIKMRNGEPIFIPKKQELLDLRNDFNVYTEEQYKFSSFSKIESNADLYFENFILSLVYKSLFAELVVIAEGYAEDQLLCLYRDKFKNDCKLGLLEYAIVYGKCFFPWIISILKKLDIKIVAIFDKDNDNEKHTNLNDIIENLADVFVKIDPKIETKFSLPTDGDKVKSNTIELRNKYIENDADLIEFLDLIDEKINSVL